MIQRRVLATVLGGALVLTPLVADAQVTQPVQLWAASALPTLQASSSTPVAGQQAQQDRALGGLVAIIVGLGLVGTGALLAATSNASSEVCVTDPFLGRQCASVSARSNGQLVSGIAMAGGGAVLIWWGAKQRSQSPSLIFSVGRGASITYRRSW
jgi:hypothetical protein